MVPKQITPLWSKVQKTNARKLERVPRIPPVVLCLNLDILIPTTRDFQRAPPLFRQYKERQIEFLLSAHDADLVPSEVGGNKSWQYPVISDRLLLISEDIAIWSISLKKTHQSLKVWQIALTLLQARQDLST